MKKLLLTSTAGSLPKPAWLAEPEKLWSPWKLQDGELAEGKQDALSLATQRYEARLGSIVELNQAQVNQAAAENDFVQALYDRELARAALEYALGRGYGGAAAPGGRPGAAPGSEK